MRLAPMRGITPGAATTLDASTTYWLVLNAVPADVPTNDAALGGLRARLRWPDGS